VKFLLHQNHGKQNISRDERGGYRGCLPFRQIPASRFANYQSALIEWPWYFLDGLNPLAAVREAGIEIENNSESGLIEFQKLIDYQKIQSELNSPLTY